MLKRVSIQNFKSLKDVTLDLQKVNLLIGTNTSGKTNFLKALAKCDNLVRGDRSIIGDELFLKTLSNRLFLHLIFDKKPFEETQGNYTHIIYQTFGDLANQFYNLSYGISEGLESEIQNIEFPSIRDRMHDFFGIGLIYKPDTNKIDKPGPVGDGIETVNADTSNLVGFLDLMLGKYRRTSFRQIEIDLRKCIPEFVEINLDDVKPTDSLFRLHNRDKGSNAFKRIGLTDGRQDVIYWADELSEGTLYFLALLCIINQPNPPKLLLLEEPEKGIHPRRLFEVMQFILGLVEDKDVQVIMTTHSPTVVDMFKDMPESVFIFDKDDEGATHVKNLLHDVIEPETAKSKQLGLEPPHYTDSLGDAWTVGFLGGVPK